MVRIEVHFRGNVQGVGFRFTTREVAAGFDVSGYVRNLPDGRVYLVAEGRRDELDRFLKALSERMADYIRESHVDRSEGTGEFAGFEIRV